jgi:hypothetical protein
MRFPTSKIERSFGLIENRSSLRIEGAFSESTNSPSAVTEPAPEITGRETRNAVAQRRILRNARSLRSSENEPMKGRVTR